MRAVPLLSGGVVQANRMPVIKLNSWLPDENNIKEVLTPRKYLQQGELSESNLPVKGDKFTLPPTSVMIDNVLSPIDLVMGRTGDVYSPDEECPESVAPIRVLHLCLGCGDKFVFASSLAFHMKRRSIAIEHQCNVCTFRMTFYNRCEFLVHLLEHGMEISKDEVSKLKFSCHRLPNSMVPQEFEPPDLMELLTRVQFGIALNPNEPCVFCKKLVKTTMHEHYHGNNVLTHLCTKCELRFPTECSWQAHRRIHTDGGPFICPECVLEFEDQPTLFSHTTECLHRYKVIQYKCPCCQARYTNATNFYDHLLHLHWNASPRYGIQKQQSKRRRVDLSESRLADECIHALKSYPDPEQCNICSKMVPSGSSFNHVRKHSRDPSTISYTYKCPTCSFTQENKFLFRQHFKYCPKQKSAPIVPIEKQLLQGARGNVLNVTVGSRSTPQLLPSRGNRCEATTVPDVGGVPVTPSPEPDPDDSRFSIALCSDSTADVPADPEPPSVTSGVSHTDSQVFTIDLVASKNNANVVIDKFKQSSDVVLKPTSRKKPVGSQASNNKKPLPKKVKQPVKRPRYYKFRQPIYNNSRDQIIIGHIVQKSPDEPRIFHSINNAVTSSSEASTVTKTRIGQISSNSTNGGRPNVVRNTASKMPLVFTICTSVNNTPSSMNGAQTSVNKSNAHPVQKRIAQLHTVQSTDLQLHVPSVVQYNSGQSSVATNMQTGFVKESVTQQAEADGTLQPSSTGGYEIVECIKEEPLDQAPATHSGESLAISKRKRVKRLLDPDFVFDGFDNETEEEIVPETDSEYSGTEETIPKVRRNQLVTKPARQRGVLATNVNIRNGETVSEFTELSPRDPSKRKLKRKECEPSANVLQIERKGRSRKASDGAAHLKNLKRNNTYDPESMADRTTMGTGLIITYEKATGNTFKCLMPQCNFSSINKEIFTVHVKTHRARNNGYQCMECGVCFGILATFTKHLFIKHQISDVDAYIRGNDCCDIELLSKIVQHRMGSKVFQEYAPEVLQENQCNICYVVCEDATKLATHFRTHGMAFLRMNQVKRNSILQQKKAAAVS